MRKKIVYDRQKVSLHKNLSFFYIMYWKMIAISNAENFHLATFYIKSLFREIPDGSGLRPLML
uniref:Uncharacterized protein n=1 Tax=Brassica oleracea var. oleracea TaxID=109376 RepID=A0A0D3ADK1_BRAOL